MAPNSLSPAYVVISYTTAYGVHKQTIPTRAWSAALGTGSFGGYIAWDASNRDAEDMINDLVAVLAPIHPTTTTLDTATIYDKPLPSDPANPVRILSLGVAGTGATTFPSKATEVTYMIRTVGIGQFKLVILDSYVGGSFDKIPPSGFGAADLALVQQLTVDTNAWSGRDDTMPNVAISKTRTLNNKLRREYGMA